MVGQTLGHYLILEKLVGGAPSTRGRNERSEQEKLR